MAESKQSPAQKAVRIALIPVLALALIAVLFWPDGDADEPAAVTEPAARKPLPELPQRTNASRRAEQSPAKRQVKPLSLSAILEHDPFALPGAVSEELHAQTDRTKEDAAARERERIAGIVEELQHEKLSVVFQDEQGVTALLGERLVREGEEIEAGVRIVRITPHGLKLEVAAELLSDTPAEAAVDFDD